MEKYLINNGYSLEEIKHNGTVLLKQYKKDIKNLHVSITTYCYGGSPSNTIGRNYSIHIDNAAYQTIFSADIQTVEHIIKALEYVDL